MNTQVERWIASLNAPAKNERLTALEALQAELTAGRIASPKAGEDVNNHIHTFYSFSPYSPAKAVWMSHLSGLNTAGIMDHDSISGAEEFTEAGRIVGLATTVGVECRCDCSNTALAGRRVNNPDQLSNAYVALHGIPHTQIEAVAEYFRPRVEARNRRDRLMVERLNAVLPDKELAVDFDRDVVPLSRAREGGSVTERHLLFALSLRLLERFGRGRKLLEFLKKRLGLKIPTNVQEYLLDTKNPYYDYDLLGALKSSLVEAFYIEATDECPNIGECVAFCRKVGAISAYAYLGDIEVSVTGDKKSQKFEDSYLELLFDTITDLGFQAVTYMPNRNAPKQLERTQALCRAHGLFEISGVDINSPRQSFTCPELRQAQFRHLTDAAWALIGHERASTRDLSQGMFSPETLRRFPDLHSRIRYFGNIGRAAVESKATEADG
jgi:hypothetical protein